MVPTAVSQIIEQIVNAVVSVVGAYMLLKVGKEVAARKIMILMVRLMQHLAYTRYSDGSTCCVIILFSYFSFRKNSAVRWSVIVEIN